MGISKYRAKASLYEIGKEVVNQGRTENQREDKAVDGTPEVGGMPYVISSASGHPLAVQQI